jgi:hypothetical protein
MKPLLVALITLAASAESIACSCLEDREDVGLLYALASVAFAGTIVEVEAYALDEFDEAPCIEGWTNSVIVIDVERVWKGDVPKRISVLSKLGDGGECGLEPRVGDYQAFFAQNLDPVDLLHVNTCTTPNVAIETIEAIVPFSVPPADGVDERAEVCRRSPPEPPPAPSCASTQHSSFGLIAALLAVLVSSWRRRFQQAKAWPRASRPANNACAQRGQGTSLREDP